MPSSFLPLIFVIATLFDPSRSFQFQTKLYRSKQNPLERFRGNSNTKVGSVFQDRIKSPKRKPHRSTRARRTSDSPFFIARFAEHDHELVRENGTDTILKTKDASLSIQDTDGEGAIEDNYKEDLTVDETNADDSLPFFADVESNNTALMQGYIEEMDHFSLERQEERGLNGTVTRRDVFRYGAILSGAVLITGLTFTTTDPSSKEKNAPFTSPTTAPSPKLVPVNITNVASKTNINVTASCEKMCVSIDSSNFTFNKVQRPKTPDWLPSFLKPKSTVVKKIPNSELLVAATAAGSVMEMVRTSLLYPLQTVKTRLQADRSVQFSGQESRQLPTLQEQMTTLGAMVREKIDDGDLYAGLSPTLLVAVPATGIYYGVRDVTKRLLFLTPLDSTWIAVGGALVGDVVSLCFRVPSDALRIRLQAQNDSTGDWLGDSLRSLPAIILTDLPYLSMKIILNKALIQGDLSVSEYALIAAFASIVAGFLTTPFDVARTRILLDKWSETSETTEIEDNDSGTEGPLSELETAHSISNPGDSVLRTMIRITKEGDGGIANLFSGWLERVLYLGIGRAWLEPIQLIGYIGIRDAVLLEWF